MLLSEKIKFIREKHKLSQTELGDALGVAQKLISNWESGRNDPSLQNIMLLIEKFNVSPSWLLTNKGDEEINTDIDMLCLQAKQLAVYEYQRDELISFLTNFTKRGDAVQQTINKLKTLKGQDFISKLSEGWTGKGERMLIVLYYFLHYLVDQKIAISPTMKTDFLTALENFNVPKRMFTIGESDKKRLGEWVASNLTEVEIIDILSSSSNIIEIIDNIKGELNILNQHTV